MYEYNISDIDDEDETIHCTLRLEILQDIWDKFGWLNTRYLLFKRLRKLTNQQDFSFRESKLLRRTLKGMNKNGKVYDLQVILEMFPGKLEETIVKESKEILKISYNPF